LALHQGPAARGDRSLAAPSQLALASREIFVDTSGMYALVDRQDAHHPAARAALTSGRFTQAGFEALLPTP
jgi:hypothetical protein